MTRNLGLICYGLILIFGVIISLSFAGVKKAAKTLSSRLSLSFC